MRRTVLAAAAFAALGLPLGSVRAQPQSAPRKIGYLHPRTIASDHPTLVILRAAWQRLGYVEGETVLLRSAGDDERRLPALLAELVGLGAGVLIVVGAAAVRAASAMVRAVPVVAIDLETDPVRAGYAASFARPGGNLTGLFLDQPSLAGKWIDLLREAAPGIERIALLWDRSTGVGQLEIAKEVARGKGFDALVLELAAIRSFDDALRGLAGKPLTGIVPMSSAGFVLVAAPVAAAAQKYRLPTIGFLKTYARAGMLMSYGPIQELYFPRAVLLADKILKGERPGDVPIEGPDRFELVLNRKTARAIGVTLAQGLLLRADEVIE
jgi:putative tryptophan/tyrosine transport system substrate-binding protein